MTTSVRVDTEGWEHIEACRQLMRDGFSVKVDKTEVVRAALRDYRKRLEAHIGPGLAAVDQADGFAT